MNNKIYFFNSDQSNRENSVENQSSESFSDAFIKTAQAYPENVAIRYSLSLKETDEQTITYTTLQRMIDHMAIRLMRSGAKKGQLVVVYVQDSLLHFVTFLAALRIGVVILPLQPNSKGASESAASLLMKKMRHFLPNNSTAIGLQCVVTDPVYEPSFKKVFLESVAFILSDTLGFSMQHPIIDALQPEQLVQSVIAQPDELAYMIFTSGSTGSPKIVAVPHGGLPARASGMQHFLPITPQDRILQFSPRNVDASILDMMEALYCGASLVLVPSQFRHPKALTDYMNLHNVTIATFVPSFMRDLGDPNRFTTLKTLISTGEVGFREVFDLWIQAEKNIVIGYGPTETTIAASLHRYCAEQTTASLIGTTQSIPGVHLHVFDKSLPAIIPEDHLLFEMGDETPGELYIIDDHHGIAHYHESDALNRQKFPMITYHDGTTQHPRTVRAFRTGDLVCKQAMGSFNFLGRLREQNKISYGRRIDLDLIVKESLSIFREKLCLDLQGEDLELVYQNNHLILGLYLPDQEHDANELLRQYHDHMSLIFEHYEQNIPTRFVLLLDRQTGWKQNNVETLSDIKNHRVITHPYVQPRCLSQDPFCQYDIESSLLNLLANILFPDPVEKEQYRFGINCKFQQLGGTSLHLSMFIAEIQRWIATKLNPLPNNEPSADFHVDLMDFYQHQTIGYLARRIRAYLDSKFAPYIEVITPKIFHVNQELVPVIFFHPIDGDHRVYSMIKDRLKESECMIFMSAPALQHPLQSCGFKELASWYTRLLTLELKKMKAKRYILVGYSAGSFLALTIRELLCKQGWAKQPVIMIDTEHSAYWQQLNAQQFSSRLMGLCDILIKSAKLTDLKASFPSHLPPKALLTTLIKLLFESYINDLFTERSFRKFLFALYFFEDLLATQFACDPEVDYLIASQQTRQNLERDNFDKENLGWTLSENTVATTNANHLNILTQEDTCMILKNFIQKIKLKQTEEDVCSLLATIPYLDCYSVYFYPLDSAQHISNQERVLGFRNKVKEKQELLGHLNVRIEEVEKGFSSYIRFNPEQNDYIDTTLITENIVAVILYLNNHAYNAYLHAYAYYYFLIGMYHLRALMHRANNNFLQSVVDITICVGLLSQMQSSPSDVMLRRKYNEITKTVFINSAYIREDLSDSLYNSQHWFIPTATSSGLTKAESFTQNYKKHFSLEKDRLAKILNKGELDVLKDSLLGDLCESGIKDCETARRAAEELHHNQSFSDNNLLHAEACAALNLARTLKRNATLTNTMSMSGNSIIHNLDTLGAFYIAVKQKVRTVYDDHFLPCIKRASDLFEQLVQIYHQRQEGVPKRILMNYARLLELLGEWDQATRYIETALMATPAEELKLDYARILFGAKKYCDANKVCEEYMDCVMRKLRRLEMRQARITGGRDEELANIELKIKIMRHRVKIASLLQEKIIEADPRLNATSEADNDLNFAL